MFSSKKILEILRADKKERDKIIDNLTEKDAKEMLKIISYWFYTDCKRKVDDLYIGYYNGKEE